MIREEPSYLPIFGLGVFAGAVGMGLALSDLHIDPNEGNGSSMSYTDLVAILLTATSTIITILGVFVAVLAIWGYSQFEKMTKDASTRHLEKLLQSGKFREEVDLTILKHVSSELAKESSPFRELLRQQVETMMLTDAARRQQDMPPSADVPFRD